MEIGQRVQIYMLDSQSVNDTGTIVKVRKDSFDYCVDGTQEIKSCWINKAFTDLYIILDSSNGVTFKIKEENKDV